MGNNRMHVFFVKTLSNKTIKYKNLSLEATANEI